MTTDHVGLEGLRIGWEDFLRSFESVRIRFEELIEVGDTIVDMATVIGIPKGTELEIEHPAAAVFEFDRGRLVQVEFHLDREEALRRAGGRGLTWTLKGGAELTPPFSALLPLARSDALAGHPLAPRRRAGHESSAAGI
jgi:SnoaL-like domain